MVAASLVVFLVSPYRCESMFRAGSEAKGRESGWFRWLQGGGDARQKSKIFPHCSDPVGVPYSLSLREGSTGPVSRKKSVLCAVLSSLVSCLVCLPRHSCVYVEPLVLAVSRGGRALPSAGCVAVCSLLFPNYQFRVRYFHCNFLHCKA